MYDTPQATVELQQKVLELEQGHFEECTRATAIHCEGIGRLFKELAPQLLYDLYCSGENREELRHMATGPVPSNQIDIAHAHDRVTKAYGGVLEELNGRVQKLINEMLAVYSGHATHAFFPSLRDEYGKVIAAAHHHLVERLQDRTEFLQHEYHHRAASLANFEGRFFSPHVAELLKSVAVSHQRAVNAEARSGMPSALQYNPIAEDQKEAAVLERNILNQMRPDELQKMKEAEAKKMLQESLQRERRMWTELDRLQKIVDESARQEGERREELERRLKAMLGERTAALEKEVESLTRELVLARLQTKEAVQERQDAVVLAKTMDDFCAVSNLHMAALIKRCIPDAEGREMERVDRRLRELQENAALQKEWTPNSTKAAAEFLTQLRHNPMLAPGKEAAAKQREFLQNVLSVDAIEKDNESLKKQVEFLEHGIKDGERRRRREHKEADRVQRELLERLTREINAVRAENAAMRKITLSATVAAREATVNKVECEGPVADDLIRRIAERDATIKQLLTTLHTGLPPSTSAVTSRTQSPRGSSVGSREGSVSNATEGEAQPATYPLGEALQYETTPQESQPVMSEPPATEPTTTGADGSEPSTDQAIKDTKPPSDRPPRPTTARADKKSKPAAAPRRPHTAGPSRSHDVSKLVEADVKSGRWGKSFYGNDVPFNPAAAVLEAEEEVAVSARGQTTQLRAAIAASKPTRVRPTSARPMPGVPRLLGTQTRRPSSAKAVPLTSPRGVLTANQPPSMIKLAGTTVTGSPRVPPKKK